MNWFDLIPCSWTVNEAQFIYAGNKALSESLRKAPVIVLLNISLSQRNWSDLTHYGFRARVLHFSIHIKYVFLHRRSIANRARLDLLQPPFHLQRISTPRFTCLQPLSGDVLIEKVYNNVLIRIICYGPTVVTLVTFELFFNRFTFTKCYKGTLVR